MRPTRSLLRCAASALVLVVAVVAFPGVSSAASAPADDGAPAPVAPELEFKAATEGDVAVIAVTDRPGAQVADAVAGSLPEGSASDVHGGRADQVSLTVDADGLKALAEAPHVERVVENRANRVAGDAWLATIGQPAAQGAGWDGAGRTIAILDTGVQVDHPYLAGKVVTEACFSGSAAGSTSLCPGGAKSVTKQAGAATPCVGLTGCEHGTHVAGIAVGGPVTSPAALNGVAPSASVIAVKVFSTVTNPSVCGIPSTCLVAYDSDVANAMAWLDDLRAANDPLVATLDAVNLSLGGGAFAGACDAATSLTPEVNNLRNRGVATVVATGNQGLNGAGSPARMSSPACVSTAVSVGATAAGGGIASFSNLTAQTTLLAPGASIRSSLPGSTYGQLSGTSMAAPMVTGAIAAVRQRSPGISVPSIVGLLQGSGDQVSTPVGVRPLLRVDRGVGILSPNLAPGSPFGNLEGASTRLGTVSVSGWAIDPDTVGPVQVVVYVDGSASSMPASGSRGDVGAVYPAYGADHGFAGDIQAAPGPHTVCAYAIDVGVGNDSTLGCRSVVVPTGPPVGTVDAVSTGLGTISISGWAIDPDTPGSIQVHVYVDAAGAAFVASDPRPDVAGAFPGYGPAHGFSGTVGAPGGTHRVCAYGINVGAGDNSLLGCRTVNVPDASPFGALDSVNRNFDGTIGVSGWAIDPDGSGPVQVLVYVAGNGYPLTGYSAVADGSRPDVGAVFASYGPMHGYTTTVAPTTPGPAFPPSVALCAYALNVGQGTTSTLGCRVVP